MYNKLCNIKKIEGNYYQVRLSTKHRQKIFNFETFYMINIKQIYDVLLEKKYQHSHYNVFLIKEPKYRIIMSEIISDKIINHLLSNEILLPIIEPRLIPMNVATRKDKGLKSGLYYTKKYINSIKLKYDNFYVLKCDIKKYFYNIDHEILINNLSKIIDDKDVLDIIKSILNATNGEITNKKIEKLIEDEKNRLLKQNNSDLKGKFGELDRIPFYKTGKGIPIGNMTSQIFAIFYLNGLDHFIKEKLHIKYYVRYMDDFILIHQDKEYLKYCLEKITEEVHKLKLELNDKTAIIPMKAGFNFIGYRFKLKNKRLLVLMNSQTKRRIVRKMNKIHKIKILIKNIKDAQKQVIMAIFKMQIVEVFYLNIIGIMMINDGNISLNFQNIVYNDKYV